jgi:hypothetical protein
MMRKSLGTLALVAIVIAGIGVSRDWFTVQRDRGETETDVRVLIHRDRIRADTRDAAAIARELGENIERRIADRQENERVAAEAGLSSKTDRTSR